MNFDKEPTPNKAVSLESISKELGFIETTEMTEIKNLFVLENGYEANKETVIRWTAAAEKIIDDNFEDGIDREKATIGQQLTLAGIYKNFNEEDAYYDTLDAMFEYAENLQLPDLLEKIKKLY